MKSRHPVGPGHRAAAPHPGWQRRQHHPDDAFDPREDGPRRGPGFGPGGPGGHRHGPGGRGPRGPRGRGRAPRGDVRAAILLLLAEEPMHGYQLMQAIADRSGGRWTPSPGAIYPAIAQLEDEGLVSVTAESGRKVVALTDAGRELLAGEDGVRPADPFAEDDARPAGPDLRHLLMQLAEATRTVGRSGSTEQREAAATILSDARRALYLLLADGPTIPER